MKMDKQTMLEEKQWKEESKIMNEKYQSNLGVHNYTNNYKINRFQNSHKII